MSAFLVSSTTLNVVVHGIINHTRTTDTPNIIGQRLLNMNHAALKARYPEDNDEPGTYVHREIVPPPRIQLYKSLQCLIYQCSEGNVPSTPEFKELEDLLNTWAKLLVSELPQYRSATWDLPEPTHEVEIIRIG